MIKKKILFVATVQSHIMNFHLPFILDFVKKGYEVHVATSLDEVKYNGFREMHRDIYWIDIPFSRKPFSFDNYKAYSILCNYLFENKFSLVHCHTPVASFINRFACARTRTKPVLYTAHGFHFYEGAPFKNWMIYYVAEKITARLTDGIITMNEYDFSLAKRKFHTRKKNGIYKVHGVGVDLELFKPNNYNDIRKELGISEDSFIFTIIAELIERKNHNQAIKAIKVLCDSYDDIHMLFVGDGELKEELYESILSMNLSNKIHFLGFRRDVPSIIQASDVIGLFSIHEGLPKILMESMAISKPIIATNIRGNSDLVSDGENGILVEINNIPQTVRAIELLYNDFELRRNMGVESQKKILSYSIDNVLLEMNGIYNEYKI